MEKISKIQKGIKQTNQKLKQLNEKKDAANDQLLNIRKQILERERKLGKKLKSGDPLKSSLNELTLEIEGHIEKINKEVLNKDKLIADLTSNIPIKDRLANLSADYPILLLPIRLQTRYMCVKHVTKAIKSRDVLDIGEITAKDRKDAKEAFRKVSESPAKALDGIPTRISPLPIGKTNRRKRINVPNILSKEKPKKGFEKIPDKDELWIRIYPDDIFVHTHEECLTKSELKSAEFFWNEIYKADTQTIDSEEKKNLKIGAWRSLVGSYGTPRSAYIVRKTRPQGVVIENGQPVLNEPPEIPNITTKENSWTKAPCSYILPDHFIVRLYSGKQFREVSGKPIPNTLILGLDPESEDTSELELEGQERKIPENIKWLTEFDFAEKAGMGIRIPLTTKEKKNGFTKIIVLGVKTSLDESGGQEHLERLLENHRYSAGGMSILKQGTPTNNTSKEDSGYHSSEIDPKLSFRNELGEPLVTTTEDRASRKDGEFISEALGVDPSIFDHIENADNTDICESIAMNRALYPATLGYSLKQFHPINVSKTSRNHTRRFFENYVLGRGTIPSFRVDSQPYGILPTTAFSRWQNTNNSGFDQFLQKLHKNVLVPLKTYWEDSIGKVNYMTSSKINDSNFSEVFLDVLGLHASSIEYYQRFVAGPQSTLNRTDKESILQKRQDNIDLWISKFKYSSGKVFEYSLMEQVKELYGPIVDNLSLSETRGVRPRKGISKNYIDFLIECSLEQIRKEDFLNFSPEETVPPYSLLYLFLRHALLRENLNLGYGLLVEANVTSTVASLDFELDQLQLGNNLRPEHEALIMDISLSNHLPKLAKDAYEAVEKELKEGATVKEKQKFVTNFIARGVDNVKEQIALEVDRQNEAFKVEQNKFICFEKKFPALTGSLKLDDYILKLKRQKDRKTSALRRMQESLRKLNTMSTARLERCFAEHIDSCSYRIDAWQQGLVSHRLESMRAKRKDGIYLGAFAILENSKPQGGPGICIKEVKSPKQIDLKSNPDKSINPVIDSTKFNSRTSLNSFLKHSFIYLGNDTLPQVEFDLATKKFIPSPVINKNISEGFIHAPTTSQAITAAVLKGGYDAHRKSGSARETLAINLTSKRVRTAFYYLQGMRNGQEIAQLLGYQFERALHDTTENTLNHLLLEFRNEFPFRSDVIHPVDGDNKDAESYHVVDGSSLLKAFQEKGIDAVKIQSVFDKAGTVSSQDKADIKRILKELDEAMDSVNDLMIAESVFQVVVGSPEASSAALKVMSESGEINQMPEVVKIPRTGLTVNHRVGIQIPIVTSSVAWTSNKPTARSKISRNINAWLKKQLPKPKDICVRVKVFEERVVNGNKVKTEKKPIREVSMGDIGLEPIDFVQFLANEDQNPQNGYIPSLIKHYLYKTDNSINQTDEIKILFEDGSFRSSTKICLFEIMPLVRSLYAILSSSRSAHPNDLMEQSKANSDEVSIGSFNNTHLINCLNDLVTGTGPDSLNRIKENVENALQNLTPIVSDDQLITKADFETYLSLCNALLESTLYNIPAATPNMDAGFNLTSRAQMVNQAEHVKKLLDKFKMYAIEKLQLISDNALSGEEEYEALKQIIEQLFGRACFVYPEFRIENHAEIDNARNNPELLDNTDKFAIEDWLLGASVVRPRLKNYQVLKYLREVFNTEDQKKDLELTQLPFIPGANNRWLGLTILDKESIPLDPISLAFEYPDDYNSNAKQMALIIDEWTETVPDETIDTGVALHYNRPNNEASQNLLLVVPPSDQEKKWKWEDLVDAVDETLTLAKIRAVEPKHLRSNPLLFRLLPATVAAVNSENNTPSLDLGRNNYIPFLFIPPLLDFNFLQLAKDE